MEARPWKELGFLGCCPSSDLYLLCVILNNAINLSASQILYFQNWDNTTYVDYIIIELMWRHAGEWSLNKKCIYRMQMTDLSVSGLTDVLRTLLAVRLTCIPPRKGCSSRFGGCFPTFLSFHPSPRSLVLFWMTFSVWDGCQSQDETNEMRISLEFWLSPQSKPRRMHWSLSCIWNSEVTFDYLPSLVAVL